MEGNDIIIGLSAIVSGLWSFFTETVAARATREGRLHSLSLMAEGVSLPDPWGGKLDTEAPEEVATPDPAVQFEFAHAFLGVRKRSGNIMRCLIVILTKNSQLLRPL